MLGIAEIAGKVKDSATLAASRRHVNGREPSRQAHGRVKCDHAGGALYTFVTPSAAAALTSKSQVLAQAVEAGMLTIQAAMYDIVSSQVRLV